MTFPHTAATVGVWLIVGTSMSVQQAWAQPAPAHQQQNTPSPRLDTAVFIGWYNGHKPELNEYDSWYNRSVYGGGSLGFYWTEHLKTEVEFGATTEDDLYALEVFRVGGRDEFVSIEHTFSTKNLTLGQHYQFFENAWFHPAVGAGMAVTWERETIFVPPLFQFDPRPPPRGVEVPEQTVGPETHTHFDFFASTGFKAYVSRRAFFRSDVKVVFGSGVRDVLARVGFGVDF